jgi:hypothetical protein
MIADLRDIDIESFYQGFSEPERDESSDIGYEITTEENYCPFCFQLPEKCECYCTSCGEFLDFDFEYCVNCLEPI